MKMDKRGVLCSSVVFVFLVTEETIAAQSAATNTESPLRCYDCMDTFKARWNPYTLCQANVTAVDVAICLGSDKFCKVERITVKGATIKITRSCAKDCYYGCRLHGYGVTQLWCTTCCNETLCNTGSGAASVMRQTSSPAWSVTELFVLSCLTLTIIMYCGDSDAAR